MKLLLLNGSPRGEASDTLKVAKAFLGGMGEDYERIDLIDRAVSPCRGCLSCWFRTPGACVQMDGAGEILWKIAETDMVVWSMPLYAYGMPAHVKALVDRLLPLTTHAQTADAQGRTHHPVRAEHRTRHMLISGCGFPDYEGNFDALVLQFRRLFGENSPMILTAEAPMILTAEAPMLSATEAEALRTPYLTAARDAGREMAESGRIGEETAKRLAQPMLDPEVYRRICSGQP